MILTTCIFQYFIVKHIKNERKEEHQQCERKGIKGKTKFQCAKIAINLSNVS